MKVECTAFYVRTLYRHSRPRRQQANPPLNLAAPTHAGCLCTFNDVGGTVDRCFQVTLLREAVEELEFLYQLRSEHFRSPRQLLVRLSSHFPAAAPRVYHTARLQLHGRGGNN